ncbi:MAG: hypothetical protein IKJ77_09120 [Firmicutes bacterium]|nr:hypothetical protein [Bacillota bacterium]
MSKKTKKMMSMLFVVALVAIIGVAGMLAYLSSEDNDVNVMTLGNVEIDQIEQERNATGDLVEFKNGKPLYPAVFEGSSIPWAAEANWVVPGDQAWKVVEANANVVDKFVTVKNTGKSDAYVRTIIAYEGDMTYGPEGAYIHVVHNGTNVNPAIAITCIGIVNVNGTDYTAYEYVYPEALKKGETTDPSLKQVYMNKAATNEVVAKYGDTYDILVLSQAVQTNGFADAKTALDTAFGGATAANVAGWFGDVKIPKVVEAADDLVAALEQGDSVVLTDDVKIDPAGMSNAYGTTGINVKNGQTVDGGGNVLDIKGAGGTWDSGINTTGGTIKDITITGSFRGIFINHNSSHSEPVILENVTLDGTTYTISCDQGNYQTLYAKDSTFKGWTSYAATLGNATFEDCYFGKGNGYAYMRPYAPTTLIGCDFEAGFRVDARAAVTFEDCTIGGVALTKDNLATLVVSNIANATVK